MLYRSPLLHSDGSINSDLFQLLTDSQVARLAVWSVQTDRPVLQLLQSARFMAEQQHADSHLLTLSGTLPHCQLFGALLPDGSTHT